MAYYRDYNHYYITQATMYIRVRKGNLHGLAYNVHKAEELTQKCQSTEISDTHLKNASVYSQVFHQLILKTRKEGTL